MRVDEAGRVWVALAREGGMSSYILPKGGKEKGEELIQTARREIAEEAGFQNLTLLTSLGTRSRLSYCRTRWITTHYFLFRTDDIYAQTTDFRHDYAADWYPLDAKLPPLLWPDQQELLESGRNQFLKLAKGTSLMYPGRTRHYLMQGLAATPIIFESLLTGISEAELDNRPDPERFTLREVVAHMADWEGIWLERMVAMRDLDNPALPSYDEGQWAIDHDYAHADMTQELAKFRSAREKTVAFLETLSGEQWERPGVHSEMRSITIGALAALVLGHDGYHQRQIVEFRAGFQAGS